MSGRPPREANVAKMPRMSHRDVTGRISSNVAAEQADGETINGTARALSPGYVYSQRVPGSAYPPDQQTFATTASGNDSDRRIIELSTCPRPALAFTCSGHPPSKTRKPPCRIVEEQTLLTQ
jgi:hypothetical protein